MFSACGFYSCLEGPPDIPSDIFPRDSMILIMADVHLAEAEIMNKQYVPSNRMYQPQHLKALLEQASVDSVRFNRSFEFYMNHPGFFKNMYDEVINEISRRQAEQVSE